MNLISRDDLKAKLDNGDDFKLVCALSEWAYQAKHIPGSLHIDNPKEGLKLLEKSDEIVVYCSDPNCPSSKFAYHMLTSGGYENVRRYEGGILDWEEAGFPIEGAWSDANAEAEATK
ncbi:rhodanese-like domain-containing protein [Candidatus Lucifugimonas marina]|uniref:Rhodanese-like domain-containing protein n=1 Tax=Candidatus Lucifugimonas marina TaxID=3038979 RepID=A0AAJ5ZJA6_9CHLR|nr:rhodanese-like domain-containing protein [SAR202 cluster bacterium JH702]MDG0869220.1 rhodanese-like domain-containing protein [SAR202 cluster bacterium JH639]WFG35837.1 rhodanese-like domain-containing protein [SAR202 cluster bacterium JH545]WFG39782.1 rhodanese-like domain-containing protein [SAR202 cluster bacterium JH1073]